MIISIESLSVILINTRRIVNRFTIIQISSHLGDELLIPVFHERILYYIELIPVFID